MPRSGAQATLIVEGAGGVLVPINRHAADDRSDAASESACAASLRALRSARSITRCFRWPRCAPHGLECSGVVMVGKAESRKRKAVEHYGQIPVSSARFPCCRQINRAGAQLRVFQQNFRSQDISLMTPDLRIWHPFTQEALDPRRFASREPRASISTPRTAAA